MAYYNDNEKILCPKCQYPYYSENFYPDQDEVTKIECEDCGYIYTISCTISRSFTVQCGDTETADCHWVKYDYGKGYDSHTFGNGVLKWYAVCTRCGENEFVTVDKLHLDERK